MNRTNPLKRRLNLFAAVSVLAVFSACPLALAFPPAPYHLIFGVVRDQYGTPLSSAQTSVVLETQSGVQISGSLVPGIAPGINYELKVPMDSGLTAAPYITNALTLSAPFKVYVVTGSVTNLPLQMSGSYSILGSPAQSTRIDLTLGADSNRDGIPDAWEQAFLASLGLNIPLSALNPNLDLARDGRTLQQEFLLGSYPFDPGNPFVVTIAGFSGVAPILKFPTMTGRSYTVLGSSDMQSWTPLAFSLSTDAPNSPTHTFYYASGIQSAFQVQVIQPVPPPAKLYLKILIQ